MEMCPLSTDWGNVADWAAVVVAAIAAGATFWAVVVAMRTSSTAVEEARRMRQEDRDARISAERGRAVARAIVLDHELYILGGEILRIATALASPAAKAAPVQMRAWAYKQLPADPLPILTRFADDLDAFGTEGASDLLSALSSWYVNRTLLDEARTDGLPSSQIHDDLMAVERAFRTFLDVLRVARTLTLEWASEGIDGLAETDF